jgi:hypothetical protein
MLLPVVDPLTSESSVPRNRKQQGFQAQTGEARNHQDPRIIGPETLVPALEVLTSGPRGPVYPVATGVAGRAGVTSVTVMGGLDPTFVG